MSAASSRYFRKDLYGLAHVTGWEPYGSHRLANVSRAGSVLKVGTLL